MLKIFLAEDEVVVRETIKRMIPWEELGFELVGEAADGEMALPLLIRQQPDLLITDIKMPILNGLELIERASRIDSRITFILLSGYGEFEYAKQAMTYGVRYYLLKPTDKQELINCLDTIREEKKQKEVQQKAEQALLLKDMQSPLEQGLLMEALDQPDNFPQVFKKYQGLLSFPEKGLYACICSFVEETYLKSFLKDIVRILLSCGAESVFPVIYVKNSALFVLSSPTLAHQETIRQSLEELHYPQQCVTFETSFLHGDTSEDLFAQIISKISRYERILLIRPETGETRDFHNNMAAPWRISKLREAFTASPAETDIPSLLDSVFTPSMTPDVAKNIALGLFLNPDNSGQEPPLDIACDFFRRLYSCTQTSEIRKLADESKESTDEIKKIITEITDKSKQVEETMQENEELQSEQQKAIERTEEVFRQIITQIEQLNAGMENINRLNADMSSNKDTVVSRMEAIASVSEQSAAATEEVNASTDQVNTTMADITDYTKTLQNIAQDLEQTIEKFRLMEI